MFNRNTIVTLLAVVMSAFIGISSFAQSPFGNVWTDGHAEYKDSNNPTRQPYANQCWEYNGWVGMAVVNAKTDTRKPTLAVMNGLKAYTPGSFVSMRFYFQTGDKTGSISNELSDNRGFNLALMNEDGKTGITLLTARNNKDGMNIVVGEAKADGFYPETNFIEGQPVERNVLAWTNPQAMQPTSSVLWVTFQVPETGKWTLAIHGHNGQWLGSWIKAFVKTDQATFEQEQLVRDQQSRVGIRSVSEIRNALGNGRPMQQFSIYDPEIGRTITWTNSRWNMWLNRISGNLYPQSFRDLYNWTVYAQFCAGMSGYKQPWNVQLGNAGCTDTIVLRSLAEDAALPGEALVYYTTTLGQLGDKLFKAQPYLNGNNANEVDGKYREITARFWM